jgi:hypothetical protein
MKELILKLLTDLGKTRTKVKKSLLWGEIYKEMNTALEQLQKEGKIEKVDCCSNVSFRIKV